MKRTKPASFNKYLIGILILSLCMMPLLGLHIHLPKTHMGTELHSHHTETHAFHLHGSQHDNIDLEIDHLSDTQQINLEIDVQLHKIIKILALITLALIFLSGFIAYTAITRRHYIPPCHNPFEIFRAMRRGPPAL